MYNATIKTNKDKLLAQLSLSGALPLDQFLNLWIGYYYSYNNPFSSSHFTTAPEISQLFGEIIALYLISKIMNTDITHFNILELGAGSGQLMADILRIFKKFNFYERIDKIYILENSELLKQTQFDKLKEEKAIWISELRELPEASTLVIANEFFDALPIKQFIKKGDNFHEVYVREHNRNLEFFPIKDAVNIKCNCPQDGIIEISPAANAIFSEAIKIIKRCKGIGIFIDYGYVEPKFRSTLRCYKDGEQTSIFQYPAEADITADVNFNEFTNILKAYEMKHELTTQEFFLKNNGILTLAQKLIANGASPDKIEATLNILIGKNEMGEKFKVLTCERLN